MAAEFVGGALLSAFLQVLFERLVSGDVLDFFRGKEPIVKLLTELRTTLYSAGLLLNDAEEKLIKDPKVGMWLDELKEAVFDADDLVYKIDTEALWNKMEGDSRSSFPRKLLKRLKLMPTSLESFDKAIKPEIEEILERLKVLLAPSNNPGLKIVEIKKLPERLPAPLVEDSDVYGRDAEKEAIIQLLLSDDASGEPLSVIPIVGMGGIGKTTLAQLVYNDARVIKNFDCQAWVTDGGDKFDLLKAMKTVIKEATSATCEIEEIYGLQIKLKEALKGKKFLIVIDDIWEKDSQKWDVLKSTFKSGLRGSKIIVTTRSQDIASIMKTGSIYHLGRISDDDGWRLFAKHAAIDLDHSGEYSDLPVLGREVINKCKGLPLAIKALGSLLRQEKNKREWSKILSSNTWELYERSKIGILPALWLSYYYLPSYLKPCFAYCGLFPKDYKFDKEALILLWMAEGFLHSKNAKKMEEVGEEYFQELISRSFFQPRASDFEEFVIHDLMHDLAHFVSNESILKVDDANLSNHARKIRYCSYIKGCCIDLMKFEGLSKAKGLRTILALPLGFYSGVCNQKSTSFLVEHLFKVLQST